MCDDHGIFLIIRIGLISAMFFCPLIFASRIKERVGQGVDPEAYAAAASSAWWWAKGIAGFCIFWAVGDYFFG